MNVAKAHKPDFSDPSERMLRALFADLASAQADKRTAEARVEKAAELIRLVISSLPSDKKAHYVRQFEDLRASGSASVSRGGEVYGNVVALFKQEKRDRWTVPEIFSALRSRGQQPADAKSVYNALNYLIRTGRLQRISRGQYVVRDYNVGLETSEEIEGADYGTSRVTEHDW